MDQEKPDYVVVAGDIGSPLRALQHLGEIRELVGDRPLAITLGNHNFWLNVENHSRYSFLDQIVIDFWGTPARELGVVLLDRENVDLGDWIIVGGYLTMNDSLPFPVRTFVTVKKIAASKNPVTPSSSWKDWIFGEQNIDSLPVEYEMKGFLMAPVEVDGNIQLFRTHRNGIEIDGHFCSTLIISIRNGSLVETFNSIYQVMPI